jgi:diguanylate cyclase (GGDEF)-like protein
MGEENPLPPPQAVQTSALVFSRVMAQIDSDQKNIGDFELNTSIEAANRVLGDHATELNDVIDREAAANHRATHDSLTGLLNRQGLMEKLEERQAQNKPFGILLIDLDKFKLLNDTHGHDAGDTALQKFGQFLSESFKRNDDEVSHLGEINPEGEATRQGGDEFVILFDLNPGNNKRHVETPEGYLATITDYLQEKYKKFLGSDSEFATMGLGMSIGSSMWSPGQDIHKIMAEADQAMYHNKQQRKQIEQHVQSATPFN